MPCLIHPEVVSGLASCTRCGRDFCPDCVITLNGKVVCAACKGDAVMDIKSGYEAGELDLASRGRRFISIVVDCILCSLVSYLVRLVVLGPDVGAVFGTSKNHAPLSTFYGLMAMGWIIPIVYEGLFLSQNGQTLGKKLLKIRVVRPDGEPISKGQAWGRGLSRFLLGVLGIVDPLFIYSRNRTTLHDRLCKTRVINWNH